MVGQKQDAVPPIGRLISDYSHPLGASLMFEGKKAINMAHFTPIRNPTAADICQMHANAIAAFPGAYSGSKARHSLGLQPHSSTPA